MANDSAAALQSTDVLVAITILRFHEQVDTHFTVLDQETYTRAIQTVFNAQEAGCDDFRAEIQAQAHDKAMNEPERSLRFYAGLIALRQEIWSVLLYRRPFGLPIATKSFQEPLEAFSHYTMYEWADRCIEWCAQALRFCFSEDYARDGYPDEASRISRWTSLWSFEQKWKQKVPICFRPIYFEERDRVKGKYFQQMWHTHECQVMGLQHIELGKIALAAHNPNLQRMGLGVRAAQKEQETIFLESMRTICGLATSNSRSQPAMVTAAVAIAMAGEYFKDRGEQDTVLGLLQTLQQKYAWPTTQLIQSMRTSWGLGDA
ncbi:hypothetical protein G7054_g11356 [Neopestalotiopsis clavispora]|nr:hypothetical protein G7054_g11356 [Neopestalotiopsis clavispora]